MVYLRCMAETEKAVRQSVSIPSAIARRVQALAKRRRTSANRVIVELIETGLEAREREKQTFFELADRLAQTSDASERKRLKEKLARMTFGDECRRSSGRTSRQR
jgi:metal-responsive CopG/Arc/MetJ family transcriptional regulator